MTEFDRDTLVLLRRPRDMREFADEELERSQAGHLAFLEQMHDEGHLVLSGPFDDQPDERLRGISLYRTSLEETTRLLAGDTAVQMRLLEPQVMTWLLPRGSLAADDPDA